MLKCPLTRFFEPIAGMCRKHQVEDSNFLEPPVWQRHPSGSLLTSLNSQIDHVCYLNIFTRPPGSDNTEIVLMLSLDCFCCAAFSPSGQSKQFPFIFSVSTLFHPAHKKKTSNHLVSVSMKCWERLQPSPENKSCILSENCGSLWIVILSAGHSCRRCPLRLDRKCLARCHPFPSSPTSQKPDSSSRF